MPQMNHKGPEGAGSMTGRKLGLCTGKDSRDESGMGKGLGKRRNAGGGKGLGKRLRYDQKQGVQ